MSDKGPILNPGPDITGTDGLSASTTNIAGFPEGNGGSTVPFPVDGVSSSTGDSSEATNTQTSADDGGSSPTDTSTGVTENGATISDTDPVVNLGTDLTESAAYTVVTDASPITNIGPDKTGSSDEVSISSDANLTGLPQGNGRSTTTGNDDTDSTSIGAANLSTT
jgi:hypothetical protein